MSKRLESDPYPNIFRSILFSSGILSAFILFGLTFTINQRLLKSKILSTCPNRRKGFRAWKEHRENAELGYTDTVIAKKDGCRTGIFKEC